MYSVKNTWLSSARPKCYRRSFADIYMKIAETEQRRH